MLNFDEICRNFATIFRKWKNMEEEKYGSIVAKKKRVAVYYILYFANICENFKISLNFRNRRNDSLFNSFFDSPPYSRVRFGRSQPGGAAAIRRLRGRAPRSGHDSRLQARGAPAAAHDRRPRRGLGGRLSWI